MLNGADWDADADRDDLRALVVEHLGAANGVLIVDETGFLKKRRKWVGVHRQYSGTAGRIEKCQIGVFMAYAGDAGMAFVDRALYLPEAWALDAERRREASAPAAITFATKPALAQELLTRAFAADVPAAWVTADEIYGDSADLHRWLEHDTVGNAEPVTAQRMGIDRDREQGGNLFPQRGHDGYFQGRHTGSSHDG